MVTRKVIRRSCSNALHYGQSMFPEYEKLLYLQSSQFQSKSVCYHTLLNPSNMNRHNSMCYHSLNALPHALPHALLYIFSEICLVLDYLQRVTTRYHQFIKIYINIYFFMNLMVPRGDALQLAPNHAKLREYVWWPIWQHVEVIMMSLLLMILTTRHI